MGVIEVVGIVTGNAVLLRFIQPDDDRVVVLVRARGHDRRDDLRVRPR